MVREWRDVGWERFLLSFELGSTDKVEDGNVSSSDEGRKGRRKRQAGKAMVNWWRRKERCFVLYSSC